MKSYTLQNYQRDKELVQIIKQVEFNIDVYDKLHLLKKFGYKNLKGSVAGLPVKELPIELLARILNDPSVLVSMIIGHYGSSLEPGDLNQLKEEGINTIISRVNSVFAKTYNSAKKRIEKYEANKIQLQKTFQLNQPKPETPLEKRVEQAKLNPRPRQQQLPGFQPYVPETSYLTPSGKRKSSKRKNNQKLV